MMPLLPLKFFLVPFYVSLILLFFFILILPSLSLLSNSSIFCSFLFSSFSSLPWSRLAFSKVILARQDWKTSNAFGVSRPTSLQTFLVLSFILSVGSYISLDQLLFTMEHYVSKNCYNIQFLNTYVCCYL